MPNCCWDISIVDFSRWRHFGFLKFTIFNDIRNNQEKRTASLWQIMSKSLKPWLRYVTFRFFKMAAAAILNFWNYKFLTVGTVQNIKLRHKFSRNRSYCSRDMEIFLFFKMAAATIFGFSKFKIFKGQNGLKGRTASSCQILSKLLEPKPRYGDFSIFLRMAADCHLGFVMRVLGPPTKGIWWSLSLCKISMQ